MLWSVCRDASPLQHLTASLTAWAPGRPLYLCTFAPFATKCRRCRFGLSVAGLAILPVALMSYDSYLAYRAAPACGVSRPADCRELRQLQVTHVEIQSSRSGDNTVVDFSGGYSATFSADDVPPALVSAGSSVTAEVWRGPVVRPCGVSRELHAAVESSVVRHDREHAEPHERGQMNYERLRLRVVLLLAQTHMFCTLLRGPIPRQAGYSVLRGSAEAAAIAWWVFDPGASVLSRA